MNLVDPLEIGGDCLELNSEPSIAGDGEAVLPHHRNQSRSIVLENLRTKKQIERKSQLYCNTQLRLQND